MGTLSQIGHKLAGMGSWLLLLLMWWLLFRNHHASTEAIMSTSRMVLATSVVILLLTFLWVGHDVRISSAKGPRSAAPTSPARTDVDRLDRRVSWGFDLGPTDALSANHIVIEIYGEEKLYVPQQLGLSN